MITLTVPADPKMLRETLCLAQGLVSRSVAADAGADNRKHHVRRLESLIRECDRHRPLGPNGKHGDRHTPSCGCDDVELPPAESPRYRAAAALYGQITDIAAAGGASVTLLAHQLTNLVLSIGLDVEVIAANDRAHPAWIWGDHDRVVQCTGCSVVLSVDPTVENDDPRSPESVLSAHRAATLRARILGAS